MCDFQNGFAFQRKNFRNTGLPIIRISNIQNDRLLLDEVIYFSLNDYKGTNFEPFKITKGDILIAMSGATTGKIGILTFDTTLYLNQRVGKFKPNIMKLNNKFLYYFLLTKINFLYSLAGGGAQPNLSSNQILQQITIPIPPLEIQQEIVKILDAFTELNTELKARKKQYQYYQNMLLDFKDTKQSHKDAKISAKTYPKRLKTLLQTLAPKGVEFKTLEEVFEIRNGYTPSKNNPEFWEKGTIPWFRMEDLRENGRILKDSIQHITPKALKGKKLFPKNSIIISTTATIGEHALLIVDSLANQRFTFLSKKANCDIALDMKFFFYQCFLLGEWCKNNTNVSGFASVDMTAFKKYKFPIPPLEIQQEIVKILDQFLALTTDLLSGIPAEIKARKKQYEYYREKLLTFKPLQNKA
ncbi:restriction endonuclease subunit S [Helicobacter pylori]|uniref:restriction endonuclease subunit S n=1 Tax=Helicobacter pylori TaxID=210 RepID=UPI00387AE499